MVGTSILEVLKNEHSLKPFDLKRFQNIKLVKNNSSVPPTKNSNKNKMYLQ